MSKITTIENTRTTVCRAKLQTIPFTDGLFAARMTTTNVTTYQNQGMEKTIEQPSSVFECLASEESITKFAETGILKPLSITKSWGGAKAKPLLVHAVAPTVIERLAKGDIEVLIDSTSKKPFTALRKGTNLIPVAFDHLSHFAFDMEGVPYMIGIPCSYIGGLNLDNGTWDLEGVVLHLACHPDVTLAAHGGERESYAHADPAVTRYWIGDIPHYNAEEGRNKCIAFMWHPPRDVYVKAWSVYMPTTEYQVREELLRVLKEQDLLGIEKFRKLKPAD